MKRITTQEGRNPNQWASDDAIIDNDNADNNNSDDNIGIAGDIREGACDNNTNNLCAGDTIPTSTLRRSNRVPV